MAAPTDLLSVLEKTAREILHGEKINVNKISVIRKSDHFSNGDIVLHSGCHEDVENEVLYRVREKLLEELKSSGQPIIKVCGDDYNHTAIYLDRTWLFRTIIGSVIKEKEKFGSKEDNSREIIMLGNECLLRKTNTEHVPEVNLDCLRSLIIQEHITCLLQNRSYTVLSLVQKDTYETFKNVFSQLGTDLNNVVNISIDDDEAMPVISKFISRSCITQSGQYRTLEHAGNEALDTGIDYVFDMRRYMQENNLNVGKTQFDKNLSLCTVVRSNTPSEFLQTTVVINKCLQETKANMCIHITGQSAAYSRQKVHLILHELADIDKRCILQKHCVYGPVTERQESEASDVTSADDLFRLRYAQLRQAAIMKYGEGVHGEGWAATLEALTAACIKFEMLSCVPRNTLKLNLSEDNLEGGGLATSIGSFVMYNCARLATLFTHFQEEVDSGTYAPLPHIDDVDFSTLREEAEWGLLFNFVHTYPELVEQTVGSLDSSDTIHVKIHTHKVCHMLSRLSRSLSSYYSRFHVLGEARAQLLPTMYARLYLLKAVHQVMINGLALMGIQPLSQL